MAKSYIELLSGTGLLRRCCWLLITVVRRKHGDMSE